MDYLAALGLTLLLEVPVYAVALRRALGYSTEASAVTGTVINLVSHPVAFLVVMPHIVRPLGFWPALTAVEAGVWILESSLLWLWARRDLDLLAAAALAANALSLAVGLLLFV